MSQLHAGGPPPEDYAKVEPYMPANWFDWVKVDSPPPPTFARPLQLRARSDGRLHLSGQEHVFTANVADLDDPVRYVKSLCAGASSALPAGPAAASLAPKSITG